MRILRLIVLLFVLALLGWLAWRWLPGLRPHVRGAYEQYGGWTEEARRSDPAGFLEFARDELEDDAAAFAANRLALSNSIQRAREELERSRERAASADELAGALRTAFRAAEGSDDWPAHVAGADYTRDELVRQTAIVLRTRETSRESIGKLEAVLERAADTELKLLEQIEATQAALAGMDAKIELARIDERAARTQELLGEIEETLESNAEVHEIGATPVRSVDELLAAEPEQPPSDLDALEFLREEE